MTKDEREKLIRQVMDRYEDEFFKTYGYVMNASQKRSLRKSAEKMVDKEIKKVEKFSI